MDGPTELTDIQRFYKNSTVFLTGATGFIGKLVLEKILRALPVKKVFILVRCKKEKAVAKRLEEIFESPAFDVIKRTSQDVLHKVVVMEGDCSLPLLGLSVEDQKTFVEEVNVIYHVAATVKFDEHIKKATLINVRATKDLITLAKQIKKLKTFVYTGTGFSNCNRREILEEVYPSKISAENLIAACESLDNESLESVTKTLIGDWPNTYTFTKQVTEDYINREAQTIPICITRPTIVVSTMSEPVSAFVDNIFTLAGFVLANGLGFNRISYYKPIDLDIVPADIVVNESIAAGWQTGETILHTFVAYIFDIVRQIQGKEPKYGEAIEKLHKFQESYERFTTSPIFLHVENTHKILKKMTFKDRELFNCDVTTIHWENYFSQYLKGLRIYLLKDPMDTLPEGRKKLASMKKTLIVNLIISAIALYVAGKYFLFRIVPVVFGLVVYVLRNLVC